MRPDQSPLLDQLDAAERKLIEATKSSPYPDASYGPRPTSEDFTHARAMKVARVNTAAAELSAIAARIMVTQ